LVDIRDATDFANWSKNKDGWDTLEEHCDPSRCAGVTMESGTITKISLPSSNLNGNEFSLAHMPRYRTTSDVPCVRCVYFFSLFSFAQGLSWRALGSCSP
jgi:hypothetical protein